MNEIANTALILLVEHAPAFNGYVRARTDQRTSAVRRKLRDRLDQVVVWHLLDMTEQVAEDLGLDVVRTVFACSEAVSATGYEAKCDHVCTSPVLKECLMYAWARREFLDDPRAWDDLTKLVDDLYEVM